MKGLDLTADLQVSLRVHDKWKANNQVQASIMAVIALYLIVNQQGHAALQSSQVGLKQQHSKTHTHTHTKKKKKKKKKVTHHEHNMNTQKADILLRGGCAVFTVIGSYYTPVFSTSRAQNENFRVAQTSSNLKLEGPSVQFSYPEECP